VEPDAGTTGRCCTRAAVFGSRGDSLGRVGRRAPGAGLADFCFLPCGPTWRRDKLNPFAFRDRDKAGEGLRTKGGSTSVLSNSWNGNTKLWGATGISKVTACGELSDRRLPIILSSSLQSARSIWLHNEDRHLSSR